MNARYASTRLTSTLLAVAVCGILMPATGAAALGDFAEGRLLVRLNPQVSETDAAALLKRNMAQQVRRIDGIGVRVLAVPKELERSLAAQLSADPRVQFAEVDRYLEPRATSANDPYFSYAWHLPQIGAPAAWDFSMGEGVIVAMIDSGIEATHPELAGQLVPGWNTAAESADTSDVSGHGTSTAGVVAAASNNGIGLTSIAWNAKLMPVRVTDRTDAVTTVSDVVEGILWAADHGARVANIGYALPGYSTVTAAADYMRGLGGVVVMPSGNEGVSLAYSANPSVLVVGATDSADVITTWSNYGPHIDLSAPGTSMLTTSRGAGYASASGTSYASPVVAGVAALVIAANPALTAADVEQILIESATDLGVAGWDVHYGQGRVNADAAVQLALAWTPTPVDEEAPSLSIDSPVAGSLVEGTVSVTLSASDNVGVAQVRLFVNGSQVGSDANAPYAFTVDTTAYANGTLQLAATALDAVGNEAMAQGVNVTVDNVPLDVTPPTAQITSPKYDANVYNTVLIKSVASDNVALASMTLYIDNVQLCTGAGPALDCSWNTKPVKRGYHYIKLVAADSSGNTASQVVRVKR